MIVMLAFVAYNYKYFDIINDNIRINFYNYLFRL